MERLLSVVPSEKKKEKFVYLAFLGEEAKKRGMNLVRILRREQIECLVEYKERSLKSQMSRANKLGADWVLIIGEEEVRKERYQLKNMASGEQKEAAQEEILEILRESF